MEVFPVEVDDDVHVLRAEGGIDARTADGLLEQVGRMIDEGATRIVLDCQDLEIVSSAGLAALLRIHTRLRTRGGDVRLAGVRGGDRTGPPDHSPRPDLRAASRCRTGEAVLPTPGCLSRVGR